MKETKRMSAAQRRARQRKQRNRRIAMTVALVLVVALASIGGTIAWLTATTGSVVNTFTVGDIDITLTEKGATLTNNVYGQNFDFVPGDTITKEPQVTVTAGSEACYLFIHVAEANNTVTVDDKSVKVINWDVRDDWMPVVINNETKTGYYYREVNAATALGGESYYILTGGTTANQNGQVTVSNQVTKDMVTGLTNAKPTLTFTAAAVQKDKVADVAAAWTNLPDSFKSTT